MASTSVAIIGAGPAGLTLARLLLLAFPPNDSTLKLTIFESDPSSKARVYQGGSLDLHPTTGLAALRKAALFDEFHKHARYEGEELYLADLNGTVYVHMTEGMLPESDMRPEIDREILRDLLLDGVVELGEGGNGGGEGVVKWGKRVKRVVETDGGRGTVEFVDGSRDGPFDLIIGADGAWSKVRGILSPVVPTYSGIAGFQGNIPVARLKEDEIGRRVDGRVGKGSYFAYSKGQSMTAQRQGNGSLKVGLWAKEGEDYPDVVKGEGEMSVDKWREKLLAIYDEWYGTYKDWIRTAENFTTWRLYELPVGFTWEHKKGFTMLGDAAHLMTPFAGEGVNAAMKDALELAEAINAAIRDEKTNLDEAIRQYETEMFPRAKKVQQETMTNKIGMFSQDAPVALLVSFVDAFAEGSGYDLNKGWFSWVRPPLKAAAWSVFWTMSFVGATWRRVASMSSGK